MEIKYQPGVGAFMLVLCLVNILAFATGAGVFNLGVAFVTGLAGGLIFTKPIVRLTQTSITQYNLFGAELKSLELTPGNWEINDNKILVDGKRIVSLGILNASEDDVRNFLSR